MKRREVASILRDKYSCYAETIIKDIKDLDDDCLLSGDDSPYRNVWEEFAAQVQGEQSIFFDAYEDTIRGLCKSFLQTLPEHEIKLLWLYTDGYFDFEDQQKSFLHRHRDDLIESIEDELYSVICQHAESLDLDEIVDNECEDNEEDEDAEDNPSNKMDDVSNKHQPDKSPDQRVFLDEQQLHKISSHYNHDRAILDQFYVEYKKDYEPDEFWVNTYKNNHPETYEEYERTWCFLIMNVVAVIWLPIKDDLDEVSFHSMEVRSYGNSSIPSGTDERFISACANSQIENLLQRLKILNVVIEKEFQEYWTYPSVANDIPKIGYW